MPMGKLRSLPGRLTTLKPRLSVLPSGDKGRNAAAPWREWYNTTEWRRLRIDIFKRDLFTCQWPGCGRVEGNTSLLVADHVVPHRGDERLFWNCTNLQTLCKPCHDGPKARVEARRGI
jgi:5-methylcytosine-specific restriction endonuclease McrA